MTAAKTEATDFVQENVLPNQAMIGRKFENMYLLQNAPKFVLNFPGWYWNITWYVLLQIQD